MSDQSSNELFNQLALGKQSEYIANYAPELLQTVPRALTRKTLQLGDNLPFKGIDRWTGYELSWLNEKGKPQVRIAEFEFPFDSEVLVESKSFKLYLNSFNQTKLATAETLKTTLAQDLSAAAGKPVKVKLFTLDEYAELGISQLEGVCIDDIDINVEQYDYQPSLLKASQTSISETLTSHLLKSNCLVTGQPDWGSVVIEYTGPALDRAALLAYLISFRGHNEFHEHCVERIFADIYLLTKPEYLKVYARYTRRGGLDINPVRVSATADEGTTALPYCRLPRQ